MNCRECEEKMLLRDVLTPTEANTLKAHLAQCVKCQETWQQVIALERKLSTARTWRPTASSALTDRIMTAIILQEQAPKPQNWLKMTLFQPFTKVALTGVSVALMLFFFVEWSAPISVRKMQSPIKGMQVMLNSTAMRSGFLAPKPHRLAACKTQNSWNVDCLKEKWKGLKF